MEELIQKLEKYYFTGLGGMSLTNSPEWKELKKQLRRLQNEVGVLSDDKGQVEIEKANNNLQLWSTELENAILDFIRHANAEDVESIKTATKRLLALGQKIEIRKNQ